MSSSKRPDPPGASPPRSQQKRAKAFTSAGLPEHCKQSSLLRFFGTKGTNSDSEPIKASDAKEPVAHVDAVTASPASGGDSLSTAKLPSFELAASFDVRRNNSAMNLTQAITTIEASLSYDAVIPHAVPPDRCARWTVKGECLLIRTLPSDTSRTKAAAFDLDGTLLVWRIAGWPSQYEHYELWNHSVISKLRHLYDTEGCKLVIFSNQGAIRSAVTGKKATFVKSLIEWLAFKVERPLHVLISTNSKKGYHKPNPGMWSVCEEECNQDQQFDITHSFFVGDSVGTDDPQGGVDERFAHNVGTDRGKQQILAFYEPHIYFGPSDATRRQKKSSLSDDYEAPPRSSINEYTAFLGGYLPRPILIVMVGVQGSGKSTFSKNLVDGQDPNKSWVHLSQDTIRQGKPGKRVQVEDATLNALRNGVSVVVDRTHLTREQRSHFIAIAKQVNVKVHAVILQLPKTVIEKRVMERTNHPGGVMGDNGVRIALSSLMNLVVPSYKEGFDLVSSTGTESGAFRLSQKYVLVSQSNYSPTNSLPSSFTLSNGVLLPSIALGTMGIGKRKAQDVIKSATSCGWKAVDTAPTYKNEVQVGQGLVKKDMFLIVKIPKSATSPVQVRETLRASLSNLSRSSVDLILLHWPRDVMETGTLQSVWQEMEQCLSEGQCLAIGVCNFSINALRQLIPLCRVPPLVNQIERHPLLPQIDLVQFCSNHDILVQSHTPLCQGQSDLLDHNVVIKIAEETGLSPAQIALMWNLQQGVAVVPGCSSEGHLKELSNIFDRRPLLRKHMQMIDSIQERKRFVAPTFMYKKGAAYTWMRA